MIKIAYIKKLPSGKYRVYSSKGRNMGTFPSKEKAEKRLRQVEFFKRREDLLRKGKIKRIKSASATSKMNIDLSDLDDFSYADILRKLRNSNQNSAMNLFMRHYKNEFEKCFVLGKKNPAKLALLKVIKHLSKHHHVDIDKDMVKKCAFEEISKFFKKI